MGDNLNTQFVTDLNGRPIPGLWLPSGEKSASAVINDSNAVFYGFIAQAGANDITIDIYDNASAASGIKLVPSITVKANEYGGVMNLLIYADSGIYLNIAGANGKVVVYYRDIA